MKFEEKAIRIEDLNAKFIGTELFTGNDIFSIRLGEGRPICVTGTALNDIQSGYNDRLHHIYDKWYRYTRKDEGGAYDYGQRMFCDRVTHSLKWLQDDAQGFHFIAYQSQH